MVIQLSEKEKEILSKLSADERASIEAAMQKAAAQVFMNAQEKARLSAKSVDEAVKSDSVRSHVRDAYKASHKTYGFLYEKLAK